MARRGGRKGKRAKFSFGKSSARKSAKNDVLGRIYKLTGRKG